MTTTMRPWTGRLLEELAALGFRCDVLPDGRPSISMDQLPNARRRELVTFLSERGCSLHLYMDYAAVGGPGR